VYIKLPVLNIKLLEDRVTSFLDIAISNSANHNMVLGVSGGVDSTLVAILAKKVGYPLYPYYVYTKSNSPESRKDVEELSSILGINVKYIDMQPLIEASKNIFPNLYSFDYGNMVSRLRAVILNTCASQFNSIVVGTGNRDEDFNLGYYTLFGDGAVHVSPIADVPKRLVRQAVEYYGFKDIAYKKSSPELTKGQTSENDLGYSYEFAELICEGLLQYGEDILLKHYECSSQILEEGNKFINSKFSDITYMILDVIKRKEGAVYKSNILHPPYPSIPWEYK
jgi:NAD+ synthase